MNQHYLDCYVGYDGNRLTIGNSRMERTWDMTADRPVVLEMTDKKTGRAWLTLDQQSQWEEWPVRSYAFYRAGITEGRMQVLKVEAEEDDDLGIALKGLKVTVTLAFDGFELQWIHLIYPELPVMRNWIRAEAKGERTLPNMVRAAEWPHDYQDWFSLSCLHAKWKCVEFADHTDDIENLVSERKGVLSRRHFGPLQGNLLFVHDYVKNAGLVFVKEGPVPMGYLPGTDRDFFLKGLNVFPSCWGFDEAECRQAGNMTTYGSAVILWDGETENPHQALHNYFRAQKKFAPHRDAYIMSNTWGDGTADGHICEEFLMNEIRRAKELGVTLFQIDDGWQKGTTGNSVNAAEAAAVWGAGYYKAMPDFWAVNEKRLPNGLTPLMDYVRENGIGLGLWFSPDSLDDYANWERDADTLLALHEKYGVIAFKMDGLHFYNKLCEENFGRMMRKVVAGSKGKVFFNLDTTASVRNGYTGRCQYGNLFVENRFLNKFGKWPNYWPHFTLRNLWMLSRYLPSERLQTECLNVKKHMDLYGDDPMAPGKCGVGYSFAMTMFANPLVWMEMTGLDQQSVDILSGLMRAYKPVQKEILGGYVCPIGQEPDGMSWTGFQSATKEGTGYLLVIRELNAEDKFTYQLNGLNGKEIALEKILGSGEQAEAHVNNNGEAVFSLEKPQSFVLYRYQLK